MEKVIEENMPSVFNRYFEPFIGGGAIMLKQNPREHKIIINDYNRDLINLYKHIKKSPRKFIGKIEKIKQVYIRLPIKNYSFTN